VSVELHGALVSPTRRRAQNKDKVNVLIAANYCDDKMLSDMAELGDDGRLLIDSGAFTAWKAGKEVKLDDYLKFLGDLPVKPYAYFMLDVIGDPKATHENFVEMRAQGFDPIPIFTRGDDLQSLEFYFEQSGRVALGGLVGTKGNLGFVNGLMAHIRDRPVHWLGFTRRDWLGKYKPDSCDSSSWARAFRYGHMDTYLGRGRWASLRMTDFAKRPSKMVVDAVRSFGVDPLRLAHRDEWNNKTKGPDETDWSAIQLLTYRSWLTYQADVERLIGTKFFLAFGSSEQTAKMLRTHKYLQGGTST